MRTPRTIVIDAPAAWRVGIAHDFAFPVIRSELSFLKYRSQDDLNRLWFHRLACEHGMVLVGPITPLHRLRAEQAATRYKVPFRQVQTFEALKDSLAARHKAPSGSIPKTRLAQVIPTSKLLVVCEKRQTDFVTALLRGTGLNQAVQLEIFPIESGVPKSVWIPKVVGLACTVGSALIASGSSGHFPSDKLSKLNIPFWSGESETEAIEALFSELILPLAVELT